MSKSAKTFSVLHLIATNFFGGPEKQIIEHCKRITTQKFKVILASFLENSSSNEFIEKAQKENFTVRPIPMNGPIDIKAQFHLHRVLKQQNVDLLVVHGYKSCVMGLGAGLKLKIPVLAYSRGYTAENIKIAFYNWLERQCLRRATGVVTVSIGQKKRLSDYGIKARNLWVVHNAVSVSENLTMNRAEKREKIIELFNIPTNMKIIITAGRFSPEKGHRDLVDAILKIQGKRNDICFVFCGGGPLDGEIKHQAKSLGVLDRCRFPGFRRDLPDIFSVMDLMVLPSLSEGLPNVVLEAFAAGKPVVATGVGGVPEVVEDGVNGYLVPPGRPDILSEAIVKMLSDPEKMKAMGSAGYERVKKDFTFEAQTEKLELIYKQMIDGRTPTTR